MSMNNPKWVVVYLGVYDGVESVIGFFGDKHEAEDWASSNYYRSNSWEVKPVMLPEPQEYA
jgi:hypothetical protein